jgi:hypothetical protein
MAQDLTVNIKTTSDVPQAMDKAKKATEGMAKQVEDIKKKFGTAFKDIFLSIAGPMAIFGLLTRTITDHLDKIKQKQEDANKAAIDGVNERMAAEDVFYARKVARIKEDKLKLQQAKDQPETTAFEFLMNDPRAKRLFPGFDPNSRVPAFGVGGKTVSEQQAEFMASKPEIQDRIRRILAEDMAKEGPISESIKQKTGDFKGPEGFSNVIGVGPNPVMEAMNAQLEEQKKQTGLLQNLVDRNPFISTDFTKTSESK